MFPVESLVVLGTCSLVAIAVIGAVFAWSWKGWLQLRHHQLEQGHYASGAPHGGDIPVVANRIDLADLRERIKKLEAIAAGVYD
ncbi:MAG: hypothetical protein ACRCUI_03070 [Polymorphobacter sp.]